MKNNEIVNIYDATKSLKKDSILFDKIRKFYSCYSNYETASRKFKISWTNYLKLITIKSFFRNFYLIYLQFIFLNKGICL